MKKITTQILLLLFVSGVTFGQSSGLVVLTIVDLSKSTKRIEKPTIGHLRQIAEKVLLTKKRATLGFIPIGNVGAEHHQVVRCNLLPLSPIDEGERISEKAKLKRANAEVESRNRAAIEEWLRRYDAIVIKHLPKNPDFSNVAEIFTKVELLLREPIYGKAQKVLIYASDLKNEPISTKVKDWNPQLRDIKNLVIFGICDHRPRQFLNYSNHYAIESVAGLLPNIEPIIN